MTRRRVAIGTLLVAVLVLGAVPVAAAELEDYLARADEAVYFGRAIAVTTWDGTSRVATLVIEHAGTATMIGGDEDPTLVTPGRVVARGGGVASLDWSESGPSGRYRVDATLERRLGRSAELVRVFEGELLRARIVFDRETGAPLATEVYDGEGVLFRYFALVEFVPERRSLPSPPHLDGDLEVMLTLEDSTLPPSCGGYLRTDAYALPGGGEQGYYTDGLFSFSLFALAEGVDPYRIVPGAETTVDGYRYRISVRPTETWVAWMAGGQGYVLVGDLPPDHLAAVLADLPRPGPSGFLARIWRAFFG